MADIGKSPVIGLYLLDTSGIPLLARHYRESFTEEEAILLGGFFSAIEIFARSSLKSNLTDIGINQKRFFFTISNENYIQVVLLETNKDFDIMEKEYKLIELIQKRVSLVIETIIDISNENMINSQDIVKNSGSTIDSIIFESTLEEIENIDGDFDREIHKGKAIDYSDITDNQLLEKINKLLK